MLKNIFRKIGFGFKKPFRYAERKLYGRRKLQRLYHWMYKESLRGMNYGGGGVYEESGERNALLYVKKSLATEKQPLTLFDVGANVGGYTEGLIEYMKPFEMQIHCFEPSRETFQKLSENFSKSPTVKLNKFGIGDVHTHLKLYSTPLHNGLASVFKRNLDQYHMELNVEEEIEIKTIDGYCLENKVSQIHLLKMDIEGNELNALKGAQGMIDRGAIHFIQFEFGGCNLDSRTYFRDFYYFLSPTFNIYRILVDGLFPITQYSELLEIFSTTNFLAERKT
jgi:FkbM family methyltransferase